MKNYAQISEGRVVALIPGILADIDMMEPDGEGGLVCAVPAGEEIPIEKRYHSGFVAALVAVPAGADVAIGDSFDGQAFGPPPEPPPMTAAQALAQRAAMRSVADAAIAPLEDAIDLDIETPEDIEALTAWKQYRVALNRIEQQPGFPGAIEWPVAPT